ncbi:biotin carboxylase [Sinobacterium caligoides]|uniref:Biotin carboxylase n=1 Tax=Sinobacterium caligoides TaxID=933926 RepID=A0A3N2E097_9GAMM|nr:ATP-grasp domain-containing protein [Sinobacterium caligoides]ROS05508.1 biotin carboxylase [Sinobacterium caligoides]
MAQCKHILVIGGIRETQDQLLQENVKITWFVQKDTMMAEDQSRPYQQMLSFSSDTSIELLTEIAKGIHSVTPFDHIGAFHDAAQPKAIAIAEALGLPFDYQMKTLEYTTNKYLMRKVLSEAGLCPASSAIVADDSQVATFLENNSKAQKFIAKPVDGTGSLGVSCFSCEQLADIDNNRPQYPSLMETFVQGNEYSVESFSENGEHHTIAITEKFKDETTFIESGHLVPARLKDKTERKVIQYVKNCLTALGVTSGPSHSEIIVNDETIFFIETHTRVGGDYIPLLVELVTGIDLYKLTAQQLLGQPLDSRVKQVSEKSRHASIQFILQDAVGAPITAVNGVERAEQLNGIEKVQMRYKAGDTLPQVKHSFDRAGLAIAVAGSADEALATSSEALSLIDFSH